MKRARWFKIDEPSTAVQEQLILLDSFSVGDSGMSVFVWLYPQTVGAIRRSTRGEVIQWHQTYGE